LFILFTHLPPGGVHSPTEIESLERRVASLVQSECHGVEWLHSYATLGDADYVDVFRAPDVETAMKVSAIIRLYGGATTEVWPATEWPRFKQIVGELRFTAPQAEEAEKVPELIAGP
jgi:uncharacterized protein with GYD domain